VSDTEIPADLIALKLDFYTAERDLPTLAGDAWNAMHQRMSELAVAINRHPALRPGPNRLKLDAAASKAAREQLAAQDSASG